MSKYLRPETLFGSKLEGYLNQKIVQNSLGNNCKNNNYKRSAFTNYAQRTYDGSDGGYTLDQLESKLLGWSQEGDTKNE